MSSPRLCYVFGQFRLDSVDKVLLKDEQPVPLTPKAIDTLLALVARHGHLVTKEELLQRVWPDAFVEENNLAQNISMLRRVLGEAVGAERFIETVPKRGYRFVAPVTEHVPDSGAVADAPAEPVIMPETPAVVAELNVGSLTGRRVAIWGAVVAVGLAVISVAISLTGDRTIDPGTRPTSLSGERPTTDVTRIAVLPFVNLGSTTEAYFVAGMTEEITSRLAGLRQVAVPSSTTLAEYDRRGKSLTRIGTELRADYIVEGSVRWAQMGDATHVRITPKLIRVADDTTVWTHPYEASISDVFKMQAEIAYQITGALQVALDARERRAVEARPTADTEAYLAYLRGIASHQQGASDTANLARARTELEHAVSAIQRSRWRGAGWGACTRGNTAQARCACRRRWKGRITQRSARLSSTLVAQKPTSDWRIVLMSDRDYDGALRELDIARVGLPNSPELLHIVAIIQQRRGRWTESLATYMRAFELDPSSTAELVALHYMHQRQYAEVRRFISVAKAANRSSALVPEAWMHFSERGDITEARRVLESPAAPDRRRTVASRGCSRASSGSMGGISARSSSSAGWSRPAHGCRPISGFRPHSPPVRCTKVWAGRRRRAEATPPRWPKGEDDSSLRPPITRTRPRSRWLPLDLVMPPRRSTTRDVQWNCCPSRRMPPKVRCISISRRRSRRAQAIMPPPSPRSIRCSASLASTTNSGCNATRGLPPFGVTPHSRPRSRAGLGSGATCCLQLRGRAPDGLVTSHGVHPPRDRTVNQLVFPARRRIIGAHSATSPLSGVSARVNMPRHSRKSRYAVARVAALLLLVATLAARAVVATTFMSVEPIPGGDVVGEPTLAVIESAGYDEPRVVEQSAAERLRVRPENDRRAHR